MIIAFLIILVIALLILLFTQYFNIKIIFDTYKTDLTMTLLWLHSFFKTLVTIEDSKPMLAFYVFDRRLFERSLAIGKGNHRGIDLMKSIDSKDVHVDAYYGFRDPYTTGIACGVISAASQLINISSIYQSPDFTADNEYIYLNANAKVNIGSTLIRYLRSRSKEEN